MSGREISFGRSIVRISILALAVIVAVALLPAPASLQDLGPTGPSPYDVSTTG